MLLHIGLVAVVEWILLIWLGLLSPRRRTWWRTEGSWDRGSTGRNVARSFERPALVSGRRRNARCTSDSPRLQQSALMSGERGRDLIVGFDEGEESVFVRRGRVGMDVVLNGSRR